MKNEFPVLSTISTLLGIFGWLVVVAGVLYAAYQGIIEPMQLGHRFMNEDLIQLISGLGVGLFGLIIIALAEVIGVLFAIEENTRTNRQ